MKPIVLITLLWLVAIGLQVYDYWSTTRHIDIGGRETNSLVLWFMDRYGVEKGLLILKGGSCVLITAIAIAGIWHPTKAAVGLFLLNCLYVWTFMRHNFLYDGIGKS